MEYHYDRQPGDGHLLHSLLTHGMGFCVVRDGESLTHPPTGAEALRRFRELLESRGYDPDTLTVSVRRKRVPA